MRFLKYPSSEALAKSPEEAAWALMQRIMGSWPMGWLMAWLSLPLSDLLAELESSNPQRISKKIGGTDIEAKALFLLLVEGILTRLSSLVV